MEQIDLPGPEPKLLRIVACDNPTTNPHLIKFELANFDLTHGFSPSVSVSERARALW
jgi:hypothetical protein